LVVKAITDGKRRVKRYSEYVRVGIGFLRFAGLSKRLYGLGMVLSQRKSDTGFSVSVYTCNLIFLYFFKNKIKLSKEKNKN
jgi:hypothetical protein